MKTTIAILLLLFCFISLIKLVSNRKWKLIYTAFGYEDYFKVIAKLKKEGVKFKTKSPINLGTHTHDRFNDNTQYDIYVKKDEEHHAVRALHQHN